MSLFKPINNFYARFEHHISSLFLVGGFIFDAFTLRRVDNLSENLWILSYLFLIGLFIILIHLKDRKEDHVSPNRSSFWYVNILQFAFGGVFSAYLVLYFRSADIMVAWPFIILLAIMFIANEFLKKHYVRLSFQISLYFLSIYWFAIFIVPVLLHKIGVWVFLLSGVLSLMAITLFIKFLFFLIKDRFSKSKGLIMLLIFSIFFLVNTLYFTNLIPPIPLSLKDAGVYHSIQKIDGSYRVTYEDHGWRGYFGLYPDFHKTSASSPVYAFSAVFAPKDLNLTILHEWQYYDIESEKWLTESVVSLGVVGGRDGGFRTYSARSNISPGKWRVNVKTTEGQTIGRLRFNIVQDDTQPALKTMLK